ncbi:MAG: N-carbamoyl-D-amino-acid hydrolase [Rhodospirillales bacterium]|nr:N-carbamoyl-D-amino-acid hydrolase [Rhodospirillales bacterium]
MRRMISVAAAQLGPISRDDSRASVIARLLHHMRSAHAKGCELVVFPELALTTFFPRWIIEDEDELDSYCESEMPSPDTEQLFDEAKKLGIGFYLGYGEIDRAEGRKRRFNTAILVDRNGRIIHKYRKIHLPGRAEPDPNYAIQHLEKKYFEVGDLGFTAVRAFGGVLGTCICNDRRWAETYRVLALRGAEMVALGYNTPTRSFWEEHENPLSDFHNRLSMQAGAYQNCMWVVGVAKAGIEDGAGLIGGSCIVAPTGEIVAQCTTREDELITADCDLDLAAGLKQNLLNFEVNRQIDAYRPITEQAGITPPPEE